MNRIFFLEFGFYQAELWAGRFGSFDGPSPNVIEIQPTTHNLLGARRVGSWPFDGAVEEVTGEALSKRNSIAV